MTNNKKSWADLELANVILMFSPWNPFLFQYPHFLITKNFGFKYLYFVFLFIEID